MVPLLNTVIADDRSWEEYIGDSNSYYPYFFALGRIPTAKWIGDWVELARSDFQSLRTYTEVESHWRNAGFTPDRKNVFLLWHRLEIGPLYVLRLSARLAGSKL